MTCYDKKDSITRLGNKNLDEMQQFSNSQTSLIHHLDFGRPLLLAHSKKACDWK